MEYDTDTDGESEAEDKFFDAQEEIEDSGRVYEHLWLAAAAYEENASFFARVKPGFEDFAESVIPVTDECFDELIDCHLAGSMYDDEGEDELSISYYDVFPY